MMKKIVNMEDSKLRKSKDNEAIIAANIEFIKKNSDSVLSLTIIPTNNGNISCVGWLGINTQTGLFTHFAKEICAGIQDVIPVRLEIVSSLTEGTVTYVLIEDDCAKKIPKDIRGIIDSSLSRMSGSVI